METTEWRTFSILFSQWPFFYFFFFFSLISQATRSSTASAQIYVFIDLRIFSNFSFFRTFFLRFLFYFRSKMARVIVLEFTKNLKSKYNNNDHWMNHLLLFSFPTETENRPQLTVIHINNLTRYYRNKITENRWKISLFIIYLFFLYDSLVCFDWLLSFQNLLKICCVRFLAALEGKSSTFSLFTDAKPNVTIIERAAERSIFSFLSDLIFVLWKAITGFNYFVIWMNDLSCWFVFLLLCMCHTPFKYFWIVF